MIVDKTVKVNVSLSNIKYLKSLGYDVEFINPRWSNEKLYIDMKVEHLKENSNITMNCICDSCGREYKQRFSRNTDICYDPCRKEIARQKTLGNTHGSAHKGKTIPSMIGDKHPRWNPNKSEYRKYINSVYAYTKKTQDISTLENYDKPRGLCGVKGAYQLDHIISTKIGFENNIPKEIIGDIKNLRIVTWEENNKKRSCLTKESINLLHYFKLEII